MFRRAIKILLAEGVSPFESYYGKLLLHGVGETAPTAKEAARDFRSIEESRLKQAMM